MGCIKIYEKVLKREKKLSGSRLKYIVAWEVLRVF